MPDRIVQAWVRDMVDRPARFTSIGGGRASSKTTGATSALVMIASEQAGSRIMCARQYQTSLEESAKPEIEVAIEELEVPGFRVRNKDIRHRNGSRFDFQGLQRKKASIKGWARYSHLWVEQGEDVEDDVWELIVPTIRAAGSRIVVTWNVMRKQDWIYRRSRVHPESGDRILARNFRDNPAWPNPPGRYDPIALGLDPLHEAEAERARMERLEPERHRHVYDGMPDDAGSHQVVPGNHLDAIDSVWTEPPPNGTRIVGLDVADSGRDMCALVIRDEQEGLSRIVHVEQWRATPDDLKPTAQRAARLFREYRCSALAYDKTGVGTGLGGEFQRLGITAQGKQFGDPPSDWRVGGLYGPDSFSRRNAQWAWEIRLRVAETAAGNPQIMFAPGLQDRKGFLNELRQPTWESVEERKIRIDKYGRPPDKATGRIPRGPCGQKSPDRFDALSLSYSIRLA